MRRSSTWLLIGLTLAIIVPLAQSQLAPSPVPLLPLYPTPVLTAEPQTRAGIGLSALISLTENHLLELQHQLERVAGSEAARNGKREGILQLLREVRANSVESALWYALPSGRYWTAEGDPKAASIADRDYFPRVIAGERIMGDLVVSKSTGKSVAIIAVPITGSDGAVNGVLGASVFLDQLSARIGQELGADSSVIYYSFDSKPQLGMVWDPSLILLDPHQISPEVGRAFDEMLRHDEGLQSYAFRGKERIVVYRRSGRTGWWYAFGLVPGGRD